MNIVAHTGTEETTIADSISHVLPEIIAATVIVIVLVIVAAKLLSTPKPKEQIREEEL